MDIRPDKPYKTMTAQEQKQYQWEKRFVAANSILYVLYAHGLAPAYEHMVGSGESFGLISAERGSFEDIGDPETSQKIKDDTNHRNWWRTDEMRTEIRDLGYGYIAAGGVFKYLNGKVIPEDTAFVPGITKEQLVALGNKFQQDSVIWGKGGEYWTVYLKEGREEGPFSAKESFHHISKGEPLPPGTGETAIRDNPAQRFTLKDVLVNLSEKTASQIKVSIGDNPKRQPFFFFRGGGGLITCHINPCGFSTHDIKPGAKLTGPCEDGAMRMGYIDIYLPLKAQPSLQDLCREIAADVKPEDTKTLQDRKRP